MNNTTGDGKEYLSTNLRLWEERLPVHLQSQFYDIAGFKDGKEILREPELDLLGTLERKTILHLQCHFGLDSLALVRHGADVTGVDFSPSAVKYASNLAHECGLEARFVHSDIYELPQKLKAQFDVVYTSYGTIGWLPDVARWAQVVAHFLKPGGRFVFVEFHPVLWMLDDDFQQPVHPYSSPHPVSGSETGTYADMHAEIKTEYVCWNHGIGQVLQSLLNSGLEIRKFREYDASPYDIFPKAVEMRPGWFAPEKYAGIFPILYALEAQKPIAR